MPDEWSQLYDGEYSGVGLPKGDWLVDRRALAELAVRELKISSEDRVLDLGCDDGFMLKLVSRVAQNIVGVDVNAEAISAGADQRLHVMDATGLAFADASFDKLYSSHTIEHIPELGAAFREAARVLRSGGEALFIYPWELFRGMAAMRSAMKLTGNPFRGRDFHLRRLTPARLRTYWEGLPFEHAGSKLVFLRTPQWV